MAAGVASGAGIPRRLPCRSPQQSMNAREMSRLKIRPGSNAKGTTHSQAAGATHCPGSSRKYRGFMQAFLEALRDERAELAESQPNQPIENKWRARGDSNSQPLAPEASALSIEPRARTARRIAVHFKFYPLAGARTRRDTLCESRFVICGARMQAVCPIRPWRGCESAARVFRSPRSFSAFPGREPRCRPSSPLRP